MVNLVRGDRVQSFRPVFAVSTLPLKFVRCSWGTRVGPGSLFDAHDTLFVSSQHVIMYNMAMATGAALMLGLEIGRGVLGN